MQTNTPTETPTNELSYFAQVAIAAVAAERCEQIQVKGYTPEHDDQYDADELNQAAACYASLAGRAGSSTTMWPWAPEFFKPSHDRLNDLAKAGALILAAIEHECRNGTAIRPMVVLRDENGFWSHPACPSNGDGGIPYRWFHERGLQLTETYFNDDAPVDMVEHYMATGVAASRDWKPSTPPGECGGWFIFSIHDTDDGPVCAWVRPQRLADEEKALAEAKAMQELER